MQDGFQNDAPIPKELDSYVSRSTGFVSESRTKREPNIKGMEMAEEQVNLTRIHEWLGVACLNCVVGSKGHMISTVSPPSDALETQIRNKLNSEDCDVLFRFGNGWVVITKPFVRVHGPTIYEATDKYLALKEERYGHV